MLKLSKTIAVSMMFITSIMGMAATPKYIFYFIGDGMGMGPVMAAQTYNRTILNNADPLTMLRFPVVGWCQTWSASSTTTDSSAAGTALSTGVKTLNGMVAMSPDTIAVRSIASHLHDAGWGVGLVTSVAADDATPSVFYAHAPHRSMSHVIDSQYADCGYEFLGGAGLAGLNTEHHDSILRLFKQNDIQVQFGIDGIDNLKSRKAVLLNTEKGQVGDIGYTVDSIASSLTLPMLTQACLDHMQQHNPDKFFMMVEGGNIDHALHANDGGAAIIEILKFNEALDIAYNFYVQHPDETLIVVTADHDTGGMAMGNNTIPYQSRFHQIPYQRKSKEAFSRECKEILMDKPNIGWEEMKNKISEDFGLFSKIRLKDKEERMLKDKFVSTFELRDSEDQKTLYANFDAFTVAVLNLFNEYAGIGFTTTGHTGNPVPLCALGVGAERFKSLNDNSEIAPAMLEIVDF